MVAVLALAFLVVPLAELAVIIAVADRIGIPETILALVAVSVAGSILAKREGTGVWRRFREAVARGELPSNEVMDGFLVLAGAALLLTPGFLTDLLGLALLLPPTRRAVRVALARGARRWIGRRAAAPEGRRTVRVISVTRAPGGEGEGPRLPD